MHNVGMAQGLVRFPGAGCVVEFMQGNAPQIAWVLEEQNGKLRLLLPNRRETALTAARLLPWSGPVHAGVSGRDAAISLLEEHKARRENLAAAINPLELWELAQGEVDRAAAQWFMELIESTPGPDAVAACGHALLQCKSHFKFQPPDFEVLPATIVQARLEEEENTQRREALVKQGGDFVRALWDNHVRQGEPLGDPPNMDPDVVARLRRAVLERLADPETQEEEALWRQLVQAGGQGKNLPDDVLLPLYLAESWGLVPPFHNFWLDRAGYDPGDAWSVPHAEAIAALCQSAQEAALPESDLLLLSIDNATTRDIDDAFHLAPRQSPDGGWILTLALACPALVWPFGSDFDKAVLRRATSLYLPEATHHMLPEELGINAYSLLVDQPRPALLIRCEVGPDGAILGCVPSLARVRLAANLSYSACQQLLAPSVEDAAVPADAALSASSPAAELAAMPHMDQITDQLRMGLELARIRQALRLRQGAVIIERPEIHLVLEGEGRNVQVQLEVEDLDAEAHLLVSEQMILANAALAQWGAEQGVPLLHRTQDVAIPKEFAGVWKAPEDIARVVKALAPASMEPTARPHAGLGEQRYAPTTSPLRRYPDLINEAQVLHWLAQGQPRWSEEDLRALLPQLNARLDAAGQVQRARPRFWKLLHLRQAGDKHWWPAVITEENEAFVSVTLPREQLFLRGRRRLFGERTHPGQPLEVRIGKVRPLHNDFTLLETREV